MSDCVVSTGSNNQMKEAAPSYPDQAVISKIYFVRGQKVMLDRDLAELYGIETRRLKEQVR